MEQYKSYAGIGSRETPKEVLELFVKVGEYLASHNYTLRSGHAKGADQAFEVGCNNVNGMCEIFLPWDGFEGSKSKLVVESDEAFLLAETYHPYWHNLKNGAKKLQARNSHQVLGWELNKPSEFIICWTKNGKGGTGQALRIAKAYNIPVFDIGDYPNINDGICELKKFLQQYVK